MDLKSILAPIEAYAPVVGVFIAALTLSHFLWRAIRKRVEGLSKIGRWPMDGRFVSTFEFPARLIALIFSTRLAIEFLPVAIGNQRAINFATKASLVVLGAWILDRVIRTLVSSDRFAPNLGEQGKRLVRKLSRAIVAVVACLVLLDLLGISITPILASLGVGSLAVALALQDTLNNLFSGIYLALDKPFRIGDFVRIDDGTEGTVRQIGWRSAHIELLSSNTVVIPNSKLASSQIVNYDIPGPESTVTVGVGVSYSSDLDFVERVTVEVAREVLTQLSSGVAGWEPLVRFHTFGESSIDMNVILRTNHWTNRNELVHSFVKALHRRFNSEKIEIPFPQRVVHLNPTPQ